MQKHFLPLLFFLFPILNGHTQKKLSVASIFSDGMVVQRNEEIAIWGKSAPGENITLKLSSQEFHTTSNSSGKWKKNLPEQALGQPINILIYTKTDTIHIRNILIGEVWLASGQSNMHLDLKRTLNGEAVAKKANNSNIRIYNMKPTFPTGEDGTHTLNELNKIQSNKYFNTNGWVEATPKNVLYFSAVAYYFAEKLQQSLNIPIGIIHNAVPGSPIESWLPEKIIDQDIEISEFVKTRWSFKKNEKDGMITVGKKQISLSKNPKQKHPWMPTYNYTNGILPIKNYKIKGVIWYQGESNAEHPTLYKKMFKKMVNTWRSDFHNDFPFYYVQLTSRENRPAWPEFRNAQRELLDSVNKSKMVVISDIGDRHETHAKNKRPVGERLALLALGDTYNTISNFESPLFDYADIYNNNLIINFKGAFDGLQTSKGKNILGFEISNDATNYQKTTAKIQRNSVQIQLPENYKNTIYIRYGWEPYTEANLISKNGLPVSTFRTRIKR